MFNFESELITLLVLSSLFAGLFGPTLVRIIHKMGWVKIDGKSYEEYYSERGF